MAVNCTSQSPIFVNILAAGGTDGGDDDGEIGSSDMGGNVGRSAWTGGSRGGEREERDEVELTKKIRWSCWVI